MWRRNVRTVNLKSSATVDAALHELAFRDAATPWHLEGEIVSADQIADDG
jgi:hypothetical protein